MQCVELKQMSTKIEKIQKFQRLFNFGQSILVLICLILTVSQISEATKNIVSFPNVARYHLRKEIIIDEAPTSVRVDSNDKNFRVFGDISNGFHELPGENILVRKERSPFRKREKCMATKDELLHLIKGIKTTLSDVNASNTETNCHFDLGNLTDCNDLVRLLQCGVSHLKSAFSKAMADNSPENLAILQKRFELLLTEYKHFDDEKRNYEQIYSDMRDEMNSLKHMLQNYKYKSLNDTEQLCIAEINNSKFCDAIKYFRSLRDHSRIPRIIKGVYVKYGGHTTIKNIIEFIRRLPTCSNDVTAFQALYDVMKDSNGLSTPEVKYIFKALDYCCPSTNELKEQFRKYADKY